MNAFQPFRWHELQNPAENCAYECQVAESGARAIAGADEAGRGPIAGPIVAAAVMLSAPVDGVDDSKRLTEDKREALFAALTGGDHAVGVAIVPPERVDEVGIQVANYQALADSLNDLSPAPDFALVDGFFVPGCAFEHLRIVKGDQRSVSIGAASIVAKVTRDRIMRKLDADYPEYGFGKHKGYATTEHLDALARYGPSPAHRRSFAPMATASSTMWLLDE